MRRTRIGGPSGAQIDQQSLQTVDIELNRGPAAEKKRYRARGRVLVRIFGGEQFENAVLFVEVDTLGAHRRHILEMKGRAAAFTRFFALNGFPGEAVDQQGTINNYSATLTIQDLIDATDDNNQLI